MRVNSYRAGASSVVSTLWPIHDADGAKFSQALVISSGCQMEDVKSSHEQSSDGLARQSRRRCDDDGRERGAYHYVLNGVEGPLITFHQ
jgi:hypothetical protein